MAIGRHRGIVQWAQSGRIELLFVDGAGQLHAAGMLKKEAHAMRRVYRRYHCRELTRADLIKVGDLLI